MIYLDYASVTAAAGGVVYAFSYIAFYTLIFHNVTSRKMILYFAQLLILYTGKRQVKTYFSDKISNRFFYAAERSIRGGIFDLLAGGI